MSNEARDPETGQYVRTTGVRSIELGTLTEDEKVRLAELRRLVKQYPKRNELKAELAARLYLLLETALEHALKDGEVDKDLMSKSFNGASEIRRLFDAIEDESKALTIEDILNEAGKHD